MPQADWGDLKVGRLLLRETFKESESSATSRTLDVEGQESNPPLTRAELVWRHDNITALESGTVHPLTFTDKPERSCYVTVDSVSADYTEWRGEVVRSDWKLGLTRLGSDAEVDLQSRLTGVARLNDFALTGERWHAPPIGHYGYQTGATNPTTMTRTGLDGTITVYRGIPTGAAPRWGCAPTSYLNGRVRLTSGGVEVCGVDQLLSPTGWALTNGLVNVIPGVTSTLDVQAYTGGAWASKLWNIGAAGASSSITTWDGATLLRNDPEHVIVRLTKGLNPGRATLDLTLRRGSRTVEGYLQVTTAATLAAYRSTAELAVDNTSYVVANDDDADGNRYACGSAKTFTAHANGGIQKAAITALDFWIGTVLSGPSGATLNSNPGFETDLAGWVANGGAAVRVTTPVKIGVGAAQFTPDGVTQYPSLESSQFAVTAGTVYRTTGWIRCATARAVDLNVNWFDGVGAYISTSTTSNTLVADTWTWYEGPVTAPVGAVTATISATVPNFPPNTDVIVADELRVRLPIASGDAATDLRNMYIGALPETIYAVRR
jgi:hypothetical protein